MLIRFLSYFIIPVGIISALGIFFIAGSLWYEDVKNSDADIVLRQPRNSAGAIKGNPNGLFDTRINTNAGWHPDTAQHYRPDKDSTLSSTVKPYFYGEEIEQTPSATTNDLKKNPAEKIDQPQSIQPYGSIVLILDDIGLNVVQSRQAIALPADVTLSFLPYAGNLDVLLAEATERRHDIMLHLPMQPMNHDIDPGPGALSSSLPPWKIQQILEQTVGKFGDFQGHLVAVNNHMGSEFMAQAPLVAEVLRFLYRKRLPFIDSLTANSSMAKDVSSELGLPYLDRDIFLDHIPNAAHIQKQWNKALRLSQDQELVIVIGHPYPVTVSRIPLLLDQAASLGVPIVPIRRALNILAHTSSTFSSRNEQEGSAIPAP